MKYSLFVLILFILACSESKTNKTADIEATSIIVDESISPIIEDQYLVFENSYPKEKIQLTYKPEIPLLNILLKDSIDIAIMSRKLLPEEARFYESRNITIRTNHIATDAIALVTNQNSTDSVITVDAIKKIMQGNFSGKSLVFDNANSSTVRYFKELANIKTLPAKGVYALSSNAEVIKYVHNNAGTIGVIGINWMKQPTIELEPIVSRLKTMAVKNSLGLKGSDNYYEPTQNNLALGLYPLSRELYIINCQGGAGSGTAFASFITSERGQRIILKSGLLPDRIPGREIIIKN